MSWGELISETELERQFMAAGKSAYSAAYLSRLYARSASANVFAEHRRIDLRDAGCAVVTFTASPWSGRSDILFMFVHSAHAMSSEEYSEALEYGIDRAPAWGLSRAVISVTDREPAFHRAARQAGFQDVSQGVVVLTDLTHPRLDALVEPVVGDLEITPLDQVNDAAMLERVARFTADHYGTAPMPYDVGPLDPCFMQGEILDPITVRPASMVMHRDGDVCGFCHVIDVVGGAVQTEWPIIVVDPSLRGTGIGFAASIRALHASRALGFVRDVSFAATTNTAVERQYSGYGGAVVGHYWKYMREVRST